MEELENYYNRFWYGRQSFGRTEKLLVEMVEIVGERGISWMLERELAAGKADGWM